MAPPRPPLAPFPLARVVGLGLVGAAIQAWDRYPLTHGSGVARHDGDLLGLLITFGGLGCWAWAMVIAHRWLGAWLERRYTPAAAAALRVATGVGLFFVYVFVGVSGLRMD